MNRKRLEELERLLRALAAQNIPVEDEKAYSNGHAVFDMEQWYVSQDGLVGNPCGTAACALGYACLHEPFRAQGLYLKGDQKTWGVAPMFGEYDGFDAAAKFFDISDEDSGRLFDPWEYGAGPIGPLDVAERVRELLDREAT